MKGKYNVTGITAYTIPHPFQENLKLCEKMYPFHVFHLMNYFS
jgi:hypothetical protein